MSTNEKHIPVVGEKLYLYTPCNNYWVSMVRNPFTVETINKNKTAVVIRAARPVFYGPVYFNTLPDTIVDDPTGKTMTLRWSEKKHRWQESPAGSYPRVAVFGEWDYQPYLN